MKQHTWVTEFVDGGHVGEGDFWICSVCQASAGPVWPGDTKPRWKYFFYADGSGLQLREDCEESQRRVELHKATYKGPKEGLHPSLRDEDDDT